MLVSWGSDVVNCRRPRLLYVQKQKENTFCYAAPIPHSLGNFCIGIAAKLLGIAHLVHLARALLNPTTFVPARSLLASLPCGRHTPIGGLCNRPSASLPRRISVGVLNFLGVPTASSSRSVFMGLTYLIFDIFLNLAPNLELWIY